jgi:hypothetical protein
MTRSRPGAKTTTAKVAKATAAKPPAQRTPRPQLALASHPEPVGKTIKGEQLAKLDLDPETSLTRSLRLHLMSEHGVIDALHLSDVEAEDRHRQLHHASQPDHDVTDHRFRPGVAYDLMVNAIDQAETVTRFLVAGRS